jgi:tetratricopeptide (TPR) repeat protein
MFGPRPADEAIRALDAVLPDNPHPDPLLCRAVLVAMLGRFAEANEIARDSSDRRRDLTGDDGAELYLGLIAATAGRHKDAVTHLGRFCKLLEGRGQRSYMSVFAPMQGRSLCELGRHDEAEPLAQVGRELADEHDTAAQALWRQVQARVDARRGRLAQAEQLAREAVAINDRTDNVNGQGDALWDLAEILYVSDDFVQAEKTLVEGLERYEQKKNLAQAAQAKDRLAVLRGDAAAS